MKALFNYKLLFFLTFFFCKNVQAQRDTIKNYKKRHIVSLDVVQSYFIGKISERRPFEPTDEKSRILSLKESLNYGLTFSFDKKINKRLSIVSDLGYYVLKGKLETESASSVADSVSRIEWYYNFDFCTHYMSNGYYIQYSLFKPSSTYLNIGGSMSLQIADSKKGRQTNTFVTFSPPNRMVRSDKDNQKIKYDFLRLQLFAQISVIQWLRLNGQDLIRLQIRYGLPLLYLAEPINLKTRMLTFSLGYKFREWKK